MIRTAAPGTFRRAAPGSGLAQSAGPERGSGTVLMLAVVCMAVLGLAAVLMFTAAAQAAAKAGTAADLAALAAADAARLLLPGDPCEVAASTAAANHATVEGCSREGPGGEIVKVHVQVHVSPVGWLPEFLQARAVARAGPPPQPWRSDKTP